jgi:ubiquinone/menaquinone biosynthesis C-methylase UbiE
MSPNIDFAPDFSKDMNGMNPLELATKSYYWNPLAALFRSLELRVYCNASIILQDPILDLGCGDGIVAYMLSELSVVKMPLCGVDISSTELSKAKGTNAHLNLIRADANHLPFKDESFSAIICNGFLSCIPGGNESPLREITRVLKKTGILIATVPTEEFIEVLILPGLLKKVSLSRASKYIKKVNARTTHFEIYSLDGWEAKFEINGLRIIKYEKFFSYRAGLVWSFLIMKIFKMFLLLKSIRSKKIINYTSRILAKLFKNIYIKDLMSESNYGYVFIIAQKEVS